MRVTLKRADFYARAALKAATDTNYYDASTSFSIYAPELADPAVSDTARPVVARAHEKLLQQHQLALDLIAACYTIRGQLAEINQQVGISTYLTRQARLAAEDARMRALLRAIEHDDKGEPSLDVAMVKAAALRAGPTDRYGYGAGDSVKVALLTSEDAERIRRLIKRLGDDRSEINDLLTAANVSNMVTLDAMTVATLRRADLLPAG